MNIHRWYAELCFALLVSGLDAPQVHRLTTGARIMWDDRYQRGLTPAAAAKEHIQAGHPQHHEDRRHMPPFTRQITEPSNGSTTTHR